MALTVNVAERNNGTIVAHIGGRLDSATFQECEQQLMPHLKPEIQMLMLDMADLDYISSAGLRVILAARKTMEQHGGKMITVNLQPQIAKVFEISDILPETDIFDSVESADTYLKAVQQREQLKNMDWGKIEE
jgi:anti-anti-sigma factor